MKCNAIDDLLMHSMKGFFMSDENVLKHIMESKAEQSLRQHINEGKEFVPSNIVEQQVLNKYKLMEDAQKQQFNTKGWKNG